MILAELTSHTAAFNTPDASNIPKANHRQKGQISSMKAEGIYECAYILAILNTDPGKKRVFDK